MNGSNEIWMLLFNNGIYEFFIIIGMYFVFMNMLNLRGRKKYIFLICFFISMFCINEIIFLLNHSTGISNREILVSCLALSNTFFYIIVLKLLTEANYLNILLSDLVAQVFTAVIVSMPYIGVATVFRREVNMVIDKGLGYKNLPVSIVLLCVMIVTLFLLEKIAKKWLAGFGDKKLKWKIVLWLVIIAFNGAGFVVCIINNIHAKESIIVPAVTMAIVFVVLMYVVSWWVRRRKEKQIQEENRILSIENTVMKEYYDTLEYQLEQTRKFRHDIEKHMSAIKDMSQESYIDDIVNHQEEDVYCSNPIINAVLVNKKRACDKEHIKISIVTEEIQLKKIKEIDFIAIISNLLDNAIDECRNVMKQNEILPEIKFSCESHEDNLYISICNTTQKEERIIEGHTTKKDKYAHGVGLVIVNELVEKYHGTMETAIESAAYETKIKLEN